mgnify:CR=1 FL=1
MTKNLATLFISFLFIAIIVSPTIISLVDIESEIAIVLENNEEEENKGQEALKDLEIKFYSFSNFSASFVEITKKSNIRFTNKKYTSLSKELISPPPEFLF